MNFLVDMSKYGPVSRTFDGSWGAVQLGTGITIHGRFRLAQYADGRIFLLTELPNPNTDGGDTNDLTKILTMYGLSEETPEEWLKQHGRTGTFEARSDNGSVVNCDEMYLKDVGWRFVNGEDGDLHTVLYWVFDCRSVSVRLKPDNPPTLVRFSIVNFLFMGTHLRTVRYVEHEQEFIQEGLISMVFNLGKVEATITQDIDYKEAKQHLEWSSGVARTCTAEVAVQEWEDFSQVRKVIDELCVLLSFCRGTRIEWYDAVLTDSSGAEVGYVFRHDVNS